MDQSGNLATVSDAEAVGQHAKQRLMAFRGEWFLNSQIGVPWIPEILGSSFDPALAESVIKASIKRTDGVEEITTFSARFNKQRRELSGFNISVRTIYDTEVSL